MFNIFFNINFSDKKVDTRRLLLLFKKKKKKNRKLINKSILAAIQIPNSSVSPTNFLGLYFLLYTEANVVFNINSKIIIIFLLILAKTESQIFLCNCLLLCKVLPYSL